MALRSSIGSWNPLRAGGTEMPPNLLLLVKIIALALLLTNHARLLPDPFLPFLPVFDTVPGAAFQFSVKAVFVCAAVALLFNRAVRWSSLALGAAILISVVASKAYYGNNKTFAGLMLFFAGLSDYDRPLYLLRWQLSLVYFGAGLNKVMDGDWQSGLFFEHWARMKVKNPVYIAVSDILPPLVAGKLMCWFTMFAELGASAGMLLTRAMPYALWANVLFQAGLLEFTGTTFTMFFYAMEAATLAFVVWPKQILVIYDGDCGLCNRIRKTVESIDFDGMFFWETYQSAIGDQHGIPMQALEEKMHIVIDNTEVLSGFAAFRRMLMCSPWFWLLLTTLIAAPPDSWQTWRRVIVGLALCLFLPIFQPAGELVYSWVARNRRRIMPGSTCGLEPANGNTINKA